MTRGCVSVRPSSAHRSCPIVALVLLLVLLGASREGWAAKRDEVFTIGAPKDRAAAAARAALESLGFGLTGAPDGGQPMYGTRTTRGTVETITIAVRERSAAVTEVALTWQRPGLQLGRPRLLADLQERMEAHVAGKPMVGEVFTIEASPDRVYNAAFESVYGMGELRMGVFDSSRAGGWIKATRALTPDEVATDQTAEVLNVSLRPAASSAPTNPATEVYVTFGDKNLDRERLPQYRDLINASLHGAQQSDMAVRWFFPQRFTDPLPPSAKARLTLTASTDAIFDAAARVAKQYGKLRTIGKDSDAGLIVLAETDVDKNAQPSLHQVITTSDGSTSVVLRNTVFFVEVAAPAAGSPTRTVRLKCAGDLIDGSIQGAWWTKICKDFADKLQSQLPNTVTLGQSLGDVEAILGPPQRIMDLAAKKVYVYKDVKIIFVNGKVADVQ